VSVRLTFIEEQPQQAAVRNTAEISKKVNERMSNLL
jgi:hypothetical protein